MGDGNVVAAEARKSSGAAGEAISETTIEGAEEAGPAYGALKWIRGRPRWL